MENLDAFALSAGKNYLAKSHLFFIFAICCIVKQKLNEH